MTMDKSTLELITVAGEYKKWALEARKKFIDLRLKQDDEIRTMYINITRNITQEIRKGNLSDFNKVRLKQILKQLTQEIKILNEQLVFNFDEYLNKNVETATSYSKNILINAVETAQITKVTKAMIQKAFYDINIRTVEAYYTRVKDGLFLSDRIWSKCKKYREDMKVILQTAVTEGQDCVKTAKMLDKYVLKGKKTLVDEYPNMIKRIGNRVPQNISYEALRLARTEMTSAYGDGVLASAMINPATIGIQFMLSMAHPHTDICDEICGEDNFGLGKGVYPINEAPAYPFHPHCLCIMLTVVQPLDILVGRLKNWIKNPMNDTPLEMWYQEVYGNLNF